MKENFKTTNRIINLFDYASQKRPPSSLQQKTNQSVSFSHKNGNNEYGFDTLLHFNDSLNLSSIQSHKELSLFPQDKASYENGSNRYDSIINRAKQDAQRLKNKRMEKQSMWKKTHRHVQKIHKQQQDRLDESLAESEVTSYNLDSQVYPISNGNRKQHKGKEDGLALELRRQIYEGKVKWLMQKIKVFYMHQLIAQLKIYTQIMDCRQKWQRNLMKSVFISWKRLIKQVQSRKYIRKAILARIKVRKQQQDNEEYLKRLIYD